MDYDDVGGLDVPFTADEDDVVYQEACDAS